MLVTYSPEGGEVQRWEFDPGRVRQTEAVIIEKQYGENWEKFCADVQAGSIKARRVMLWHLIRREHHTLKFEDTPDFFTSELVVEHTAAELTAMRDKESKAGLPMADLEQALAVLDAEIAAAEVRDGELLGKAALSSDA